MTIAAAVTVAGCGSGPSGDNGARGATQTQARALSAGDSWYIQYGGTIDYSQAVQVYDLDGFDTPASNVSTLQSRGVEVLCYINAGAYEDWRPDASNFPQNVLGNAYPGWPGEQFLDIRQISALAPIMQARLDMCARNGFTGIDADNIDSYTGDEDGANETGFNLTAADAVNYALALASWAHQRGLKMGQKNAPDLTGSLEPSFDFAVTESCYADGWCSDMAAYGGDGKPVFAIEYDDTTVDFNAACSWGAANAVSFIYSDRDLDGGDTRYCP